MASICFWSFILPLVLVTFSSMISDTMVAEARKLPQSTLPLSKVHKLSKLDLPPLPNLPVPLPLPELPNPELPPLPLPSLPVPLPPLPKPELPAVPIPDIPVIPEVPKIPEIPKPELPIVPKP